MHYLERWKQDKVVSFFLVNASLIAHLAVGRETNHIHESSCTQYWCGRGDHWQTWAWRAWNQAPAHHLRHYTMFSWLFLMVFFPGAQCCLNVNFPFCMFHSVDLRLGQYDSSRKYKSFANVFVGASFSTLSSVYNVTLATQSSLERMYELIPLVNRWDGPVSLAVGLRGHQVEPFQEYIRQLVVCWPDQMGHTAVSLVIPANETRRSVKRQRRDQGRTTFKCQDSLELYEQVMGVFGYDILNNSFQSSSTMLDSSSESFKHQSFVRLFLCRFEQSDLGTAFF